MARHSSSVLLPLLLLAALLPGRPFIGGGSGRAVPRSALRALGDRPWRRKAPAEGEGAVALEEPAGTERPSPFGGTGRAGTRPSPFGQKGQVQGEEPPPPEEEEEEEEEGNRRDVLYGDRDEEAETPHLGSTDNPPPRPKVTMDGAGAQLGAAGRRKEAWEQRAAEDLAPLSVLEPGMAVRGRVRDYSPGGILIDVGVKQDGLLPLSWLKGQERPKIGGTLDVFVDQVGENKLTLSLESQENLRRIEEISVGAVLSARVTAVASHGVLLDMRLPGGGQPIEGLLLNKNARVKGWQLRAEPCKELTVQVLSKKQEGGRVKVALVKEKHRLEKLDDDMLYLGMRINGRVGGKASGGVFVDIGAKCGHAFLPESEFSNQGPPLKGEDVTVYLNKLTGRRPWVSCRKHREDLRLALFEDMVGEQQWVDAVVNYLTDWGAIVDVSVPNRDDTVKGKLHLDHVPDHKELQNGRGVKVRVLSVDVENRELVVSMLFGDGRNNLGEVRKDLSVFEGVSNATWMSAQITTVKEYGAFVLVRPPSGGTPRDGLLHVRNILGRQRKQFADARDHVTVGQRVQVRLYRLDIEKGVLGVTAQPIEEPAPDPLKPGTVLDGVVSAVEPIGAFIEVEPAGSKKPIEGLLRFSDESEMDSLAVGEEVRVRVMSLDPETKQLDLDFAKEEEAEVPAAEEDEDEEEDE